MNRRKKIVVIGGGTGTFTVLSGLKKHLLDLTAIVTMADDGGANRILRDELGVLPPSDVRQCLVALSSSDRLMRALMSYRFYEGRLKGLTFGNLLLSALEKITGSFDSAVEKASEILRLKGRVVPVTLTNIRLHAELENGAVVRGEHNIDAPKRNRRLKIVRAWLEPAAAANPAALRAIRTADLVVLGPGDLYTSLVPNLLVRGVSAAIRRSRARKIFVCNLMVKAEHAPGATVQDFTAVLEKYLGGPVDKVIYNTEVPARSVLKRYSRQGEAMVIVDSGLPKGRFIGARLVGKTPVTIQKADAMKRSLIRHDPDRLARAITKYLK